MTLPLTTRLLLILLISASAFRAAAEGFDARRLVAAARSQVGVTVLYDPGYRRLQYPGGDVAPDRGVCTDVVIRALRVLGLDLQVLVHEDMKRAWAQYPKIWGLKRPDTNIDHRRVPNLMTYFRRQGYAVGRVGGAPVFQAGDLVTWKLPSGVPHIGIVSDRAAPAGHKLVIHNIGAGTREEDVLFTFERTGHYRLAVATARVPDSAGTELVRVRR